MTEQEIQAANLQLSFEGVDEAEGGSMTAPGTIGKFKINTIEFTTANNEKKTPGLKTEFVGEDDSSFTHTFWLSTKALGRVKHLAKHFAAKELTGPVTTAQLMEMLRGTSGFLKVTAQINEDKGRAYPDLPFAGFANTVEAELKFNNKEIETIERGKTLSEQTNIGNADQETDDLGGGIATDTQQSTLQTQASDDF